jgi:hypothetical protein
MASRVTDGYFETMRTPIIEGRGFLETDTRSSPRVAVLNETLARHYWAGPSPVGKRFRLNDRSGPLVEIVGIARNSKYINFEEAPTDLIYLPYVQMPPLRMALMVETVPRAAELASSMRDTVGRLDAGMPVLDLRTMEEFYQVRGIRTTEVIVQLVTAIGLMGMLLALIGLYGLVSYAVSRRTREIGIRMAIGAGRWEVMRMVLRQGFTLTMCGLGAGLLLSLAARKAMVAAFPFHNREPMAMVLYPLLTITLWLVTMLAAYIPARRASRVDPLMALRHE